MQILTSISLDLKEHSERPVVCGTQGDRNTRCLEVKMYLEGSEWVIPSGTAISLRYSKPDGTLGYYDTLSDGTGAATVQGNVITMVLPPQLFLVPGTVLAQLEFRQEQDILGTGCFLIQVESNPAAEATEPEDYINWLQWMKQELQEAIDTGDFTGPQGPQGERGKAFTYSDFTPQQLAALTGPSGENGTDGKTPVRGTDYWTAEDQQTIVTDVLAALPVWEGGSY